MTPKHLPLEGEKREEFERDLDFVLLSLCQKHGLKYLNLGGGGNPSSGDTYVVRLQFNRVEHSPTPPEDFIQRANDLGFDPEDLWLKEIVINPKKNKSPVRVVGLRESFGSTRVIVQGHEGLRTTLQLPTFKRILEEIEP